MANVFFMRHGDTFTGNQEAMTVAEASKKISLSELGKSQCRKVVLPRDLDLIVISDSKRTKESAKIVLKANKMSLPIKVEKKLHPWDSGSNDWKTYYEHLYEFVINPDKKGPWESRKSLVKRVDSVLRKYSDKNILVIAHSALLGAYLDMHDSMPCAQLIRVK